MDIGKLQILIGNFKVSVDMFIDSQALRDKIDFTLFNQFLQYFSTFQNILKLNLLLIQNRFYKIKFNVIIVFGIVVSEVIVNHQIVNIQFMVLNCIFLVVQYEFHD